MIIEVDCNIDEVRVDEVTVWKVKEPNLILNILEEILNRLTTETSDRVIVDYNIQLYKIDEDRRTTVGEW